MTASALAALGRETVRLATDPLRNHARLKEIGEQVARLRERAALAAPGGARARIAAAERATAGPLLRSLGRQFVEAQRRGDTRAMREINQRAARHRGLQEPPTAGAGARQPAPNELGWQARLQELARQYQRARLAGDFELARQLAAEASRLRQAGPGAWQTPEQEIAQTSAQRTRVEAQASANASTAAKQRAAQAGPRPQPPEGRPAHLDTNRPGDLTAGWPVSTAGQFSERVCSMSEARQRDWAIACCTRHGYAPTPDNITAALEARLEAEALFSRASA